MKLCQYSNSLKGKTNSLRFMSIIHKMLFILQNSKCLMFRKYKMYILLMNLFMSSQIMKPSMSSIVMALSLSFLNKDKYLKQKESLKMCT